MTSIRKELWTIDSLIYRLKEHLATIPISSNHKTDLLDWYPEGHENKVIDFRKYYNQAYHFLKIGCLAKVPKFLISMHDLESSLLRDLADLGPKDRYFVLMQAVGSILEDISPRVYHDSISKLLEVELVK